MTSPPHGWERAAHQAAIAEALQALGISRLILAIHDASFPAGADDPGRGTPCSDAGRAFLGFARALGFSGVQLGPQGLTTRDNPSPYDAMLFSREPLSIHVAPLVGRDAWQALVGDVPWTTARHADHAGAFDRQYRALAALWRARGDAWARDVDDWARGHGEWLARDAAMDAMPVEEYRFVQWLAHQQHDELRAWTARLGLSLWGDLQIGVSWRDRQTLAPLFLDGYAMGAPPSRTNPEGQPWGYPVLDPAQYDGAAGALVVARMGKMLAEYDGLRVDHPHGLVDPWVYRTDPRAGGSVGGGNLPRFAGDNLPGSVAGGNLPGSVAGGNLAGSVAGDNLPGSVAGGNLPGSLAGGNLAGSVAGGNLPGSVIGGGLRGGDLRGGNLPSTVASGNLAGGDGRGGATDAHQAVRAGARLFSSPDLPDHPRLAPFAIARAEQLDRGHLRWADGWVRALDEPQVDRYAALFDRVVDRARVAGHRANDLLCEVLSTWPYPLRRVMEREGLGRLCVTQKANLDDPRDVYRSENARACDWIMVGNHDTPPLWALVDRWHGTATAARRAQHLAERLEPDPSARPAFAESLRASPGRLATAMFAELFASPARSVSIFFADLLGYRESYNAPGTVSDANWRLRVAPDFATEYARAVASDDNPRALSLPRALAMALRADKQRARVHEGLLLRLDAFADEH